MRRVFKSLGNAAETIGYRVERVSNRRREYFITKNVRRMRCGIVIIASIFDVVLPIVYLIQLNSPRLLPAVPLGVSAIAVAGIALRAHTPGGAYLRILLALLLLALAMTAAVLANELWG